MKNKTQITEDFALTRGEQLPAMFPIWILTKNSPSSGLLREHKTWECRIMLRKIRREWLPTQYSMEVPWTVQSMVSQVWTQLRDLKKCQNKKLNSNRIKKKILMKKKWRIIKMIRILFNFSLVQREEITDHCAQKMLIQWQASFVLKVPSVVFDWLLWLYGL